MYSNKYDEIIGRWTGKAYTLLRRLGSGGIGEIYLVQDAQGKLLALKLSTDIISITKEYRFLCKYGNKEFVPKVYDLDDYIKQGTIYHYFTMEYIEGCNLKHAVKETNLSTQTKLSLLCIIIQIIKQLNEEGYVYTDLKRENIMVDRHCMQIKLIDFGSLVQIGSTVKEFTPMYDRLCWGKGRRIADKNYQVFSIAMLFISLMLNRSLDPSKEKLETALYCLKKKVPYSIFEVISRCLEGQIWDCDMLFKEISCASEEPRFTDKLIAVLNILITILTFLLAATIFAFNY